MEKAEKQNIVIFPFMAQGHIIPFLALALKLEQKGCSITYINTPLNIKKLQLLIPPNSSIRLVEIPFNSSDYGLPPDAENSDDLPYNLVFRLLEVSPNLEPSFRKLLADLINEQNGVKPLCIIADFFFGWSIDVAHDFGIFHAIFSGAGGFGLACFYSIWLHLPHRHNTEKGEFMLPDFPEAGKFHVTQLSPSLLIADGSDPFSTFKRECLPTWVNSDGFLFNTVEEVDKIGLIYFRRKLGIPVWAVGPILLPVDERAKISQQTSGITPQDCIEWLNTKSTNSVLYISFGSQTTISASQMMQLAKALDAGGTNFIWVIRPPIGFDANTKFVAEEWLPERFLQRITDQKKGLVVEKWAPQLEILSHNAVAAFLCHCGWNSVLESLINGVALIGWPIAGDQFYNAKLLVEWVGVCVEVARGINFDVRHEDIRDKIELVMGENDKGKEIKKKALEVKDMIMETISENDVFKGSSVKAMEEFFNAALRMKEETELMEQSN